MKTEPISAGGILIRIVLALVLVLATYNPSGHSYFHWALADFKAIDAVRAFAGALLLACWVFAIRTTMVSMGALGIVLLGLVLGTLVWLLFDIGAIKADAPHLLIWIVLVTISLILGVGLSWSALRQRLTGQVEAD
jgi:hypothetical protein